MKVEFFRHAIGEREKAAVAAVLDGLFLTTGDEVYAFEREFADYLAVPYVVAVSSCTSAEHLALLAHGIGPGDEVITTPLTFLASATAILHTGATPVFVDVDPVTGNIEPALVEAAVTERTKAIVAVHLYGTLCDMRPLRDIADRHGLVLVEDAAHCVEGKRDGVRVGHLGAATCFSFYATKTITSGEGGAVAVHDEAVADQLRVLRLHGMSKNAADRYRGPYSHWDMVSLGYKCNMTNMQAAMLRPQLPLVDERRDRREALAARYDEVIDSLDGIARPHVPEGARSGRHLYTVWTEPERRDAIIAYLGANGIGCAVNFRAIHELTWLRENVRTRFPLPEAERIGSRTISLPYHNLLTEQEVDHVSEVLARAVEEA